MSNELLELVSIAVVLAPVTTGFTELYKVSAELTEVLRGRETAGSDELYAQVKEQYTTLTDAIRELAGN